MGRKGGLVALDQAVSADDGTFHVRTKRTTSGALLVRDIKKERYAWLDDVTAPRASIDLVLRPAVAISGTIEGLADGARGISVSARSGVFQAGAPVPEGNTFRIPSLMPGTYDVTITVWSTKQSVTRKGIEAGTADVVFKLEPK